MRIKSILLLAFLLAVTPAFSQIPEKLDKLQQELEAIRAQEAVLLTQIEELKLQQVRQDLHAKGLPALNMSEEVIHHTIMSLVYDEEHEQAKWVAHIITPDIIEGTVSRTNDFRPDPKVQTGTAQEEDYFLKYQQDDGSYKYDGYGYDRGHLAPSADFRWSRTALSESYFYSNMSPQVAGFNRGRWAELENFLRDYISRNPNTQLYIVTGPILKPELPKLEQSPNGLSIPKLYFKAALDLGNRRAIGFIMPNEKITAPLQAFAVSIDKVEEETGLDLYPALPDDLENQLEAERNTRLWQPPSEQEDAEPLYPPSLPRGHFNTVQAAQYMDSGKEITICGTVVSTHQSRKKNIFLNLDQKFPNQIFTATIWKDNQINFSYEPHKELMGKQICIKGEVRNFDGKPSINVVSEEQISLYRTNE